MVRIFLYIGIWFYLLSCSSAVMPTEDSLSNLPTDDDEEASPEFPDDDLKSPTLKAKLSIEHLQYIALGERSPMQLISSSAHEYYLGIGAENKLEVIELMEQVIDEASSGANNVGVDQSWIPEDPNPLRAFSKGLFDSPKALLFTSREFLPPRVDHGDGRVDYCWLVVMLKKDQSLHCVANIMPEFTGFWDGSKAFYYDEKGENLVFRGELHSSADAPQPPAGEYYGIFALKIDGDSVVHRELVRETATLQIGFFHMNSDGYIFYNARAAGKPDELIVKHVNEDDKEPFSLDASSIRCMVVGKKDAKNVYALETTAGSGFRFTQMKVAGSSVEVNEVSEKMEPLVPASYFENFSCIAAMADQNDGLYFLGVDLISERLVALRFSEGVYTDIAKVVTDQYFSNSYGVLSAIVEDILFIAAGSNAKNRSVRAVYPHPHLNHHLQATSVDLSEMFVFSIMERNGKMFAQGRLRSDNSFVDIEVGSSFEKTVTPNGQRPYLRQMIPLR